MKKSKWQRIIFTMSLTSMVGMLVGCNNNADDGFKKALQEEIDRRVASGELSYPSQNGETTEEEIEDASEPLEEAMGIDLEGKPVKVDGDNVILLEQTEYSYSVAYKIGGIYPAGEYVALADNPEQDGYYVASIDEKGEVIVTNDWFSTSSVFDTSDAKYLQFSDCKLYPIDKAPQMQLTSDGGYPEGEYKVGVQIPAGEYVVKANNAVAKISVDSTDDSDAQVAYFHNMKCVVVTVKEGQYLKVSGGNFYPIEKTLDLKVTDGKYKDGMYKVGFHMPAGTYILKADVDTAYVDIYQGNDDESKQMDELRAEPEIEFTVEEGQYVDIVGGVAMLKK